ncbi:MAG: TlpA family protein disulfide reductase [Phycisphaerales bacterium]|nr:TlpA family protein disulfide reductase [Phycisphaerales bacterium]
MTRSTIVRSALSLALLTTLAGSALASKAPEAPRSPDYPSVRRDGVGEKRAKLDALELKAFDSSLLGKLNGWTNGEAPSAEAMKDKVTVFVMWANWRDSSVRAVQNLASMQEAMSAKGVQVIAVHDSKNFDAGKQMLSERGIKILSAHDEKGEFRKALLSEQNPDIYIVDKAGQLRFADVDSASVQNALDILTSETPEVAKGRTAALIEQYKAEKAEKERTKATGAVRKAGEKITVSFKLPDESAYSGVLWSKKNDKEIVSQLANDIQDQKFPVEFGKDEEWLSEKPDFKGRVLVVDFWATWCGPCMRSKPALEHLATKFRDDLVILGFSGYGTDRKVDVERYLREHATEVFQSFDTDQKIYKQLQIQGIPTVYIISTDGKVRWMGSPLQPEFQKVVEWTIDRDPGVKARRDAEASKLKTRAEK